MRTALRTSAFVNVNGIRLHYLDWDGDGPALLFLTGLACNAYIFDDFAPRFADRFHVLALTRRGQGDSDHPDSGYDVDTLVEDIRLFVDALGIEQIIFAGHSYAGMELSHFAALYPQRVLKLVFLDTVYDRTSPVFQELMAKNPLFHIPIPGQDARHRTIEETAAAITYAYPNLAQIWGELMEEHLRHEVFINAEGYVEEKTTPAISQALMATVNHYASEDSKIRAPLLSFRALPDSATFLSYDYMTAEQQAEVVEYFSVVRPPLERACIEEFRRRVPHAKIVEIPNGHHYCFIKQADLVFEEMRRFLLE